MTGPNWLEAVEMRGGYSRQRLSSSDGLFYEDKRTYRDFHESKQI